MDAVTVRIIGVCNGIFGGQNAMRDEDGFLPRQALLRWVVWWAPRRGAIEVAAIAANAKEEIRGRFGKNHVIRVRPAIMVHRAAGKRNGPDSQPWGAVGPVTGCD